jgi:hypothetical protein
MALIRLRPFCISGWLKPCCWCTSSEDILRIPVEGRRRRERNANIEEVCNCEYTEPSLHLNRGMCAFFLAPVTQRDVGLASHCDNVAEAASQIHE